MVFKYSCFLIFWRNWKLLGKPRPRWEGNTKMDLKQDGIMDWIYLALGEEQVAGSCEHRNEPSFFI
jgi:hypothetical protein